MTNDTLVALLASWPPLEIDFPKIEDVLPLDEEDILQHNVNRTPN